MQYRKRALASLLEISYMWQLFTCSSLGLCGPGDLYEIVVLASTRIDESRMHNAFSTIMIDFTLLNISSSKESVLDSLLWKDKAWFGDVLSPKQG